MSGTVEKFAPRQNGDVAPALTFATGFYSDPAIAVGPTGQIAIAGGYPENEAGIHLYAPTGASEGRIAASHIVGNIFAAAYDAKGNLCASSAIDRDFDPGGSTAPSILELEAHHGRPGGGLPILAPISVRWPSMRAAPSTVLTSRKSTISAPRWAVQTQKCSRPAPRRAQSALFTSSRVSRDRDELRRRRARKRIFRNTFAERGGISAGSVIQDAGAQRHLLGSGVYLGSCSTSSIAIFAPGRTSGPPARSIIGPHTHLLCPYSISVDKSGNIFVSDPTNRVLVFDSTSNGDAAPMQSFQLGGSDSSSLAIGPR